MPKEVKVNKYRRIEVRAFSRRVTIVSGEWPRDFSNAKPPDAEDDVPLDDPGLCKPVEPDSPEGQLILVEAMRSLERRLSPEARATIRAGQNASAPHRSKINSFYHNLRSIYHFVRSQGLRFDRREKRNGAARQSVGD